MTTTREAPVLESEPSERTPPKPIAVRAAGVSQRFGDLDVLAGIDLDIREGEVVGLVGPSGCGKSTLLELVSGLAAPTSGTLEVEGSADHAGRLRSCAY